MSSKEWKSIPIGSLVLIEWGDAWTRGHIFRKNDCEDLVTLNTGWVVDKSKEGIKICRQKTMFEEIEYKYEHYIPKGMIRNIMVLKK